MFRGDAAIPYRDLCLFIYLGDRHGRKTTPDDRFGFVELELEGSPRFPEAYTLRLDVEFPQPVCPAEALVTEA